MLSSLLLTESVGAQVVPEATSEPEVVDEPEVVIRSGLRRPGATTSISAEELDAQQPANLGAALERLPGIWVRQEPGGGQRLDVGFRGREAGRSRRVVMLEDGVPIAMAPYANPSVYYAPAIERVERIEASHGVAALRFGPQTAGSAVEVQTLSPPEQLGAWFDGRVGSYGYGRLVLGAGGPLFGASSLLQMSAQRQDGPRAVASDVLDGLAKSLVPLGDSALLSLRLGLHHEDSDSDGVGLLRDLHSAEPRHDAIASDDRLLLDRYDVSAALRVHLSDNVEWHWASWLAKTHYRWNRQRISRATPSDIEALRVVGDEEVPHGAIYFLPAYGVIDRDALVGGSDMRLLSRWRRGNLRGRHDAGVRVSVESTQDDERLSAEKRVFGGEELVSVTTAGLGAGAWLIEQLEFSRLLTLDAGLRAELAWTNRSTTVPGFEPATRATVLEQLTPAIELAVGKRLKARSGVYGVWAPPVEARSRLNVAQNRLVAERGIVYEAGLVGRLLPGLHVDARGYLAHNHNQLVVEGATGSLASGLTEAGATRVTGIESSLRYRLFGGPSEAFGLDTLARYTWTHGIVQNGEYGGQRLPYVPEHKGVLALTGLYRDVLSAQVAWMATSDQTTDLAGTVPPDITGRIGKVPARHELDLAASYHLLPTGLTFRVTVENLLDDVSVYTRRPDGIFTGGYRRFFFALSWKSP